MAKVIRLGLGFVNAYLIRGAQGDILVDAGAPGQAGALLRALKRAGSGPEQLRLILLTHVHADHVGALPVLRKLSRAPLAVHALEAAHLATGPLPIPQGQTPVARALLRVSNVASRLIRWDGIEPDVLVDDSLSLVRWGLDAKVIHTPGHTAGSVSVLMPDGECLVGDLCQNAWGFGLGKGRYHLPLADLPESVMESWRKVITQGAGRLYPGHGRPLHVSALTPYLHDSPEL